MAASLDREPETGRQLQRLGLFWGRSRIDRTAAVFEEIRIFSVAVTRAQNHVVLIGADTGALHRPGEKPYSWQDEVRAAEEILQQCGARQEPPLK
jgi:ATP-dependent exoDNAse (exonuclease V) beta subunit